MNVAKGEGRARNGLGARTSLGGQGLQAASAGPRALARALEKRPAGQAAQAGLPGRGWKVPRGQGAQAWAPAPLVKRPAAQGTPALPPAAGQ